MIRPGRPNQRVAVEPVEAFNPVEVGVPGPELSQVAQPAHAQP